MTKMNLIINILLLSLPTYFEPLSEEEVSTSWGRELLISKSLQKNGDLQESIFSLKRARALVSDEDRKNEIQFMLGACYHEQARFQEALQELYKIPFTRFPSKESLLVLIFDSFSKNGNSLDAKLLAGMISKFSPQKAAMLEICQGIRDRDINSLQHFTNNQLHKERLCSLVEKSTNMGASFTKIENNLSTEEERELSELIDLDNTITNVELLIENFKKEEKSTKKASILNAIVPGSGYLYLGKYQSAWTALALNSLFIGATYHFVRTENYPAAAIFLSFETGWYLGGIFGVMESAKRYNNYIFDKNVTNLPLNKTISKYLMVSNVF